MPRGSFFDDDAKRRTTAVIREIESETAAEVVVTVRPRASRYVGTTLLAAAICALATFLFMWFSPIVYNAATIPLDTALTFVVVALIGHYSDFVHRRFTRRAAREAAVAKATERAFVELGIAKTREHTGILVFVSLLEGSVRIRPDSGIDANTERALLEARYDMEAAVKMRDLDRFLTVFRSIAAPLAAQLPRREDDVNELSDTVA